MLRVEITMPNGATKMVDVPDDAVIGKGAQNEIRLDSWRIGKEHAHLFKTPSGVLIEDIGGFGGVIINGQRINGQSSALRPDDVIGIGPFELRVMDLGMAADESGEADTRSAPDAAASDETVSTQPARAGSNAGSTAPAGPEQARRQLEFEWRKLLHGRLLEVMDLRRQDVHQMSDDRLRAETTKLLAEILADIEAEIPPELDRKLLSRQVLDEAIGLGPLEELLTDDSVSEVMVNRYDEIYVERAGKLSRYPLAFTGDRAVVSVIERIVTPLGRRIDESSPMVDARLKDGSRVNAIIPPLALKGACITIRKFAKRKLEPADLIRFGSLDAAMAEFLQVCVEARKSIVVSGGTGSGKTTLLNILSNFIPSGERIITVEDAAELKLHHEHLISLESRPSNVEGKGAVSIRDLVRNTLRMRPDRIVVGECRGAEALDMLQAMNTGHEGSLTTLHANTVRDALARLETMVMMAGMDLPLTAIREQIASAVDIIIQQNRFACGSRIVTSIAEITGIESGIIQMQEIFRFHNQGIGENGKVRGSFLGCDMVPSFYDELRATGRPLDIGIFMTGGASLDDLGEELAL